jgi:NADH:ubiquinone oxidoreductase subunit 4 (subunit M)
MAFAFAVKVPMFPFHIWLPEAHVEAPTGGSILLAGILLKLGFYGFYRFLIPLFPFTSFYYGMVVVLIGVLSVIHSGLAVLRQGDAKRIVAYCSISHMNIGIVALFTFTKEGTLGSVLGMLSHGLVSAALFFLIGVLYRRYGSRLVFYYGGLNRYMPLFSIFFFLFVLGNIAFPLTFNFIAEFMMLIAVSTYSKLVFLLLCSGIIFNLVVSLYFYCRICYGVWKSRYLSRFIDLTYSEYAILYALLFLTFTFGIFGTILSRPLMAAISSQLLYLTTTLCEPITLFVSAFDYPRPAFTRPFPISDFHPFVSLLDPSFRSPIIGTYFRFARYPVAPCSSFLPTFLNIP